MSEYQGKHRWGPLRWLVAIEREVAHQNDRYRGKHRKEEK